MEFCFFFLFLLFIIIEIIIALINYVIMNECKTEKKKETVKTNAAKSRLQDYFVLYHKRWMFIDIFIIEFLFGLSACGFSEEQTVRVALVLWSKDGQDHAEEERHHAEANNRHNFRNKLKLANHFGKKKKLKFHNEQI